MATKRSTYIFPTWNDFNSVKDHIYRLMQEDYNDDNKIYFYGSWGSYPELGWDECYRIDIYSDCTNPVLAASIFKEHNGRFYDC